MIIGNGFIANAFSSYKNNDNVIIFASGVSNSQNKDKKLFEREILLVKDVLEKNTGKLFIYFSTCSINDISLNKSKYVKHKIKIENIIKNNINNYFIIVRTTNVIGFSNNPNTLLNSIFEKVLLGRSFIVLNKAKRNIIDILDLFKIVKYIIENGIFLNDTIDVANTKSYNIFEIITFIEKITGKKAIYKIKEGGGEPKINTEKINDILKKIKIDFNENYSYNLIKKYYFL